MKFIGFYNYTVILTYISLISGIVGIHCAFEYNMTAAICCLILSGVCDMFDGVVARSKKDRTEDEKNFGIQLDSLCDVICFGVFPAIIVFFKGVDNVLGIAILTLYVLCAVIRLSFFNILETKRQKSETGCAKFYRGLPVTSSAIIFPFVHIIEPLFKNVSTEVYYALTFVTAILFIFDLRIPKLDIANILCKLTVKKTRENTESDCCENKPILENSINNR